VTDVPLFYVAHRLFAAHDRALGASVADQLAHAAGEQNVFLPFCDTDEENLISGCKGQALFELDRARLRQLTGMIAVLHGPSLDDGVCMETGYAAALGVPVVAVTTDFQTFAPAAGEPAVEFADPILEVITARVLRVHRLSPGEGTSGSRYHRYLQQNITQIRQATTLAVSELQRHTCKPRTAGPRTGQALAYLEPSPYMHDDMWAGIERELRARGWRVHTAQRMTTGREPIAAAKADWAAATTAALAAVDTRGPETPPGAAVIIGACSARGVPVLAARTGTWTTLADGREPNWRNLMIQYAVHAAFSDIHEFTLAIQDMPCPPIP
jgi:nucleoside 2-deoxyribosyltransferase